MMANFTLVGSARGEIQSAGIYNQSSQKKKKAAPIDSKNKTTDDLCDFNELDNDNSFAIEDNLNVIQEEEKTLNSFEEDIKQIEEDLRLAGYGETIELFDISKLKGKIGSISKTNHGSRFPSFLIFSIVISGYCKKSSGKLTTMTYKSLSMKYKT